MSQFVLIIPTYNSSSTIVETLRATLSLGSELQLLKRVIISDDGSKDDTLDLVRREWNSSVPLQILISPQNRGEYLNVNSAVMSLEPEVEWYLMMHSDNLPKEGWVRSLVEAARRADKTVGSVCTSYDNLRLGGRLIPGEARHSQDTFAGTPESIYGTLRSGCWWHNSTAIVRVSAFKQIGGMPANQGLRQMGDWDFSLRLFANGWSISYLATSLVVYRENELSVSSANFRTHRDVADRIEVTRRFCAGCPVGVTLNIFSSITEILLRRIFSSLPRANLKRLFSAILLFRKVFFGLFYCLARSSRKPEPLRHDVAFEKKDSLWLPVRQASPG